MHLIMEHILPHVVSLGCPALSACTSSMKRVKKKCVMHSPLHLLWLQAQACADALMEKVAQLNSRTLDLISARCFFYYARVYELRGELAGIRR